MIWTMELASWLDDAPWPATRDELIDYANRQGAPLQIVENLQELEAKDAANQAPADAKATPSTVATPKKK